MEDHGKQLNLHFSSSKSNLRCHYEFAISFQTRYVNLFLFSCLCLKMQIGRVHLKKSLWERGKKECFSEKILTEIAFAYLPKYIPRKIFFLKPIWKCFLEAWCFRRSTFWVDRAYTSSLSTLLFISCYDMVLKSPRWCLGCSQTILTIWKP